MGYARSVVLACSIVFMLPWAIDIYSQEMQQESKPDVASAKIENMKPEPVTEEKSDPVEAEHDHTCGVENRLVAVIGDDGVQHVMLTGGDYYFDPNYIVVKVNVPVELKVRKAPGYLPHNIIVKAPEAGMDFNLDLGNKWRVITFMATKIGKYEMLCDKKLLWFKSHKDRGMTGYIDVVP